MKSLSRFWNNVGNLALMILVGGLFSGAGVLAAQQAGKKTSAAAQPSPTSTKLSPAEVKQKMLKLVAAHKPTPVVLPIAVTPSKLKRQDVILKLQTQKQTADSLRMTILASARKKGLPSQTTVAPGAGGTGDNVEANKGAVNPDPGGPPGAKSSQPISAQSRISPGTNAAAAHPAGSTTRLSPVINPNISAVAVCHGPTIDMVNGQLKGAWFSPDPQYNHYVIQGCGFGDQQGAAHLYGPFAIPTIGLAIEFWSDTSIIAAMDPNITGEPDHVGNVMLVVAPANEKQVQATGLNFYAARQEVQLVNIPQSQVVLQPITDAIGSPVPASLLLPRPSNSNIGSLMDALDSEMTSAPSGTIGKVVRSESGRFGSAKDSFYFGQLTPGFYPDKYEFRHSDITQADCSDFGSQTELYIDGNWNVTWDDSANALQVTTQEQHCHERGIGGFSEHDFSLSDYWLAVWVVGPRGVSPWPSNLQ